MTPTMRNVDAISYVIETNMIVNHHVSSEETAAIGALLLARSLIRLRNRCGEPDCECCEAIEQKSHDEIYEEAQEVLKQYFMRAKLAHTKSWGIC